MAEDRRCSEDIAAASGEQGEFSCGESKIRFESRAWLTAIILFCVAVASSACSRGDSGSVEAESISEVDQLTESSDSQNLVCTRDDDFGDFVPVNVELSDIFTSQTERTPFRCLRFVDATTLHEKNTAMQLVDIREGAVQGHSGGHRLQLPLHEIKTKAFLRGKSLAILSDGKRFAALENECDAIKESGISEVVAVLPTLTERTDELMDDVSQLPRMMPQEFIAERSFGAWHVINATGTENFKSPLFRAAAIDRANTNTVTGRRSAVGLVRTLIVFDSSELPDRETLSDLHMSGGQAFVLDGGAAGMERYQIEATAMARALAGPRINERGCAG